MDQTLNQNVDNYIGKLDHNHLLHLLREKEIMIENLRRENEELLSKMKDFNKMSSNKKSHQSRYWRKDEHERFLEALEKFGKKDVKSIAEYVGTRTPTQVRTHAQKWFLKKRDKEKRGGSVDMESDMSGMGFNSDDSGDSLGSNFNLNRSNSKSVFTKTETPTQNQNTPIMNNSNGHTMNFNTNDTPEDIQSLLNGIRMHDNETDLKKKIELIRKNFLQHKTIEDITRMIAFYPIVFDPNSADPQKRYFLLPNNPIMLNSGMYNNLPNIRQNNIAGSQNLPILMKQQPTNIKQDPNISFIQSPSNQTAFHFSTPGRTYDGGNNQHEQNQIQNSSVHIDPNELTFMTDNLLKKDTDSNKSDLDRTSISENNNHDNDEDLENELQDLHKKNSKGLGGFLGHPVCLSPNIFISSPLGFGSPLLGHSAFGGTPIVPSYGFGSPKSSTSPVFFIGADHNLKK